jgi:hypothetical protein
LRMYVFETKLGIRMGDKGRVVVPGWQTGPASPCREASNDV